MDWGAIGAIAGVIGALGLVGGAVVKTTGNRMTSTRTQKARVDLLMIRLFGLPKDDETGAPKVDGEFDRVYHRLDALPHQIIEELKRNGTTS